MNTTKLVEHANGIKRVLDKTSPVAREGQIEAIMRTRDTELRKEFVSALTHLLGAIPDNVPTRRNRG